MVKVANRNDIPEIDHLNAEQLGVLIARAGELRAARLDEARQALLEEMEARAGALGLSVSDLMPKQTRGRKTGPGSRGPVAPRFQSPSGETWSGRGRAPRWLTALESQGRKREEFAV